MTLFSIIVLVSQPVLAQQEGARNVLDAPPVAVQHVVPSAVGSGVFAANPVSVLLGLLLVIVIIFSLAWMLRRMGGVPLAGNPSIKVLAGLSVGAREKIMLIDVGGKQLLLGVAPGRVSSLHCFDEPVLNSSELKGSDFSLKIKQFMGQGLTKGSDTPHVEDGQINTDSVEKKSI